MKYKYKVVTILKPNPCFRVHFPIAAYRGVQKSVIRVVKSITAYPWGHGRITHVKREITVLIMVDLTEGWTLLTEFISLNYFNGFPCQKFPQLTRPLTIISNDIQTYLRVLWSIDFVYFQFKTYQKKYLDKIA
jgi:hypothetical protein